METAVAENYDTNPAFAQGGNLDIPAFGGPMGIRWDEGARVTPWGGLAYFATFLRTTGLFDRLVEDAPFAYASPNAPDVRNVVGTAVLAILAGFTRYCHIERLRRDAACAALLGLTKIVSDESLRRGLKKCDEATLDSWLARHERESCEPLLQYDYVMDVDNSVKCIFGHQEGAELGYNPQKPGRPSHNYHTAFIGTLRIVLTVDVKPGRMHSGKVGMEGVFAMLDSLPRELWPRLLRGDVGYGGEGVMANAEARALAYLFKVRRSRNVCALFKRLEDSPGWKDCGCGWEAMDTVIRLDGWSKSRRCLLVRRPAKEKPEAKPARRPRGRPRKNAAVPVQQEFEFVECAKGRAWDCYALVTNDSGLDPVALTQLYRDRGDCENNFDEYKNQWGWCGFVTQKIKPTRAMARLIAIVANWWNVFCRLAEGGRHMEAVTSRPMLMGIVGRIVESGRKRYMHLTSTHAEASGIRESLERIGAFLGAISATAPLLGFNRTWTLVLRVAFRKWLGGRPLDPLFDGDQMLLRLSG